MFYMLTMLINVYEIYTGHLSVQAQYSRFCPISSSFRYYSRGRDNTENTVLLQEPLRNLATSHRESRSCCCSSRTT
jgi:hypothetical protein